MKNPFIFVASLLLAQTLFGQNAINGKLIGKVIDGKGASVEFASIAVLSSKDSTLIKGTMADSAGVFRFDFLAGGRYFLQVSSIGFKDFSGNEFVIDQNQQEFQSIIKMSTDEKLLETVVVKGSRPVFENQLGKLIVNVNSGAFKTAKNAIDVLSRSPNISVGRDGGLSIKGLYSPAYFIDGRESSVNELKSISPEDIDQIEIISNPSAKYEGENRAVINIKLKRDKDLGLKGTIYSGITYNKYFSHEDGFTLQYKRKKTAYFGRYEYFNENHFNNIDINRQVKTNNKVDVFDQFSFSKSKPIGSLGRISMDYFINSKKTIGVLIRSFNYNVETINDTDTKLLTQNNTKQYINTIGKADNPYKNISLNVNYSSVLDSMGSNFSTNFDIAKFSFAQKQNFVNSYQNPELLAYQSQFQNNATNDIIIKSAKLDYLKVLGNKTKLELGIRGSMVSNLSMVVLDSLRNNIWINDALRSNQFNYSENIVAFYGTFSKEYKNNDIQIGLRAEKTIMLGNNQKDVEILNRNFSNLLPSLQARHTFNSETSMGLSYSKKIIRPSFQDLNPFKFYIDPYSYTEGNSLLYPTIGHQFDISVYHKNISGSLFYRNDKNVIAQLPIQDGQTKIIRFAMSNVDARKSMGADFNFSYRIADWWQTQSYAVLTHDYFKSYLVNSVFTNKVWSGNIQTTSLFRVPKLGNLEASYNYLSPSIESVYRIKNMSSLSFGLQKSFAEKIDLKINVSDVFYKFNQTQAVNFDNLESTISQRKDSRFVYVRLTYLFGKSTFSVKNHQSGNQEDENRVKR